MQREMIGVQEVNQYRSHNYNEIYYTLEEIGKLLGITVGRVRQIIDNALEKMRYSEPGMDLREHLFD